MTHSVRRIGRSLAFVLPVVLVLSGTLAVTSVPWAGGAGDSRMLTASSQNVSVPAVTRTPQDVLRDRLLADLRAKDPGTVLTQLQREVEARPSLGRHCMSIARALGRAAVDRFGPTRAQQYSKPVCDTSFAAGVAQRSQGS
ncbi:MULTISPECIES: hypothetical protein [Streptomyces]|uniref:Uncharacterized protein n=1 Tax=Streptomyces tsukubensis (strain DSM 42081 / NBRC 108919 / NRRL 18488 / 9993) TaxID=1114943 RepID=I2N0X5_STRT9|nr:hypothetical protein [Streptomyces tsukubensis]MYS66987.1 hypothetical protein [Streptomyces sp. SID5473]AZK94843.1 hypothetical protein B7R87_13930 [Streptomyces tsukubensis]EIF90672.1 hypothetical protein [Streptomyces tsukubensis NRRL18488]QKM69074.1 hypothetical protein STSU_019840 [Streptomyces tsukubensis NRRL18488]TAI40703.1 hypothetical protein EWI31_30395 [Streptomyces tsukubensis]